MTDTVLSFTDLELSAPLLKALTEVGYETPSPIQAACIPHLLAGNDLLGEAQTGTGKTAAFALPLLQNIDLSRRQPQVLVLTPTRELAIQVAEAFQRYARHLPGFHVLPIYGGQSMVVQLRALQRGVHVIVGTPGRVMDHIERKSLQLEGLRALVLDEADEMLRMGFIDDVEWILEHTPAERQTALFSATMPDVIRRVARKYLRSPQEVKIKSATSTVAAIRQKYWQVRGTDKVDAMTRILEVEDDFDAGIVFVRTKIATEEIATKLEARGYACAALNGDMNQGLRERVIEQLKSGAIDLVVATDVAARGIDVPRVSHVFNYDVPYDTEAYVHRIGRTGRAGRQGTAILFVAHRELRMLRLIEAATRAKIEQINLPSRDEVAERRVSQFKQQVQDIIETESLEFFQSVVSDLESEHGISPDMSAAALAWLATRERPLQPDASTFPDVARQSFDEKPTRAQQRAERFPERSAERSERPAERSFERPAERNEAPHADDGRDALAKARDRAERAARAAATDPRDPREIRDERAARRPQGAVGAPKRYRIEVGRALGATPKEIVGAIANEGGIEGRYIGQIHLFDDYSTVELPGDLPPRTLEILQRTRVCQVPIRLREMAEGEAVESRPRSTRPMKASTGAYADRAERAVRSEFNREGEGDSPRASRPPYSRDDAGAPERKPYAERGAKPWEERGPKSYAGHAPKPFGDRPAKPFGDRTDKPFAKPYGKPGERDGAPSRGFSKPGAPGSDGSARPKRARADDVPVRPTRGDAGDRKPGSTPSPFAAPKAYKGKKPR